MEDDQHDGSDSGEYLWEVDNSRTNSDDSFSSSSQYVMVNLEERKAITNSDDTIPLNYESDTACNQHGASTASSEDVKEGEDSAKPPPFFDMTVKPEYDITIRGIGMSSEEIGSYTIPKRS